MNGDERFRPARVDDLVDGAIRLGQHPALPDPQGRLLPQLAGLGIVGVFHVFHLPFHAQDVTPEAFVMMYGALHAGRPMQDHDFEGVHHQDVARVVARRCVIRWNYP